MDPTDDSDDVRRIELETLEAIFPELRRPENSPFTFELEIPVELAQPLTVTFPPAGNAVEEPHNGQSAAAAPPPALDSLQVSHLPPISILVTLPDGYPESQPPRVALKTTLRWLSDETLARLEQDAPRLWEEAGRDMVAYAYIDHVQRGTEDVFGTMGEDGTLAVDAEHKVAVLDYDIKAKKAAFERETFECGVCLDPKKGTNCHKMLDCGHIFCLQCLCDFYGDAIKNGELLTVRCLTPNCAKERASKGSTDTAGRPVKKLKTYISPSELLQIGLSEELVKRYVTLKYKTQLESDKNTIYCPRQWCNGAARSKKHKKPQGLELVDLSDEEEDDDDSEDTVVEDATAAKKKKKKEKAAAKARFNPADLLCVCDDCGLAFCSRCLQSWHGEFVRCTGKKTTQELTEEEQASIAYLELHTSPCPTCSAPAQKTHGCNHMACSRCDTHFCYLCSAWLDPTNPYKHYNMQPNGKVTSCYMRLWELEGGDGDDVGLGFDGGQGQGQAPAAVEAPAEEEILVLPAEEDEQEEESDDEGSVLGENNGNGAHPAGEPAPRERGPAVAREAPLVLRVMDEPAQRPARNDVPAAPAPGDGRRGRGGGRGGVNDRAARRGGGARGGGARGGGAAAARGRGRGAAGRGRGQGRQNQHDEGRARQLQALRERERQEEELQMEIGELNPQQEAWVRQFVAMALEDAEDNIHDSDEDDIENMIHWNMMR
ncbi:RING finger protein [Cordyceps fumosorosea ARSEF 2679]|uniref:RBR-type E3 ubiquitin transferase n=1 Tax=Cordyceps fumosorosea (strain ARSEF 2679) TaxID=1081104 RepID=A0A167YB87_CORFA|nr:RING finger protein [Cordyceps fumosorosea ARSEF 2679]OAA66104.1 RING finger protein [Cordyceps fumosorosea ARSEF 2679]